MRLLGTFRPKLDDKGRVFLPAKFRNELAGGVVVTQGMERCLFVWPPEVYDQVAKEVEARPMTSKAARDYQRLFFSGGDDVVPDKQGRISISADMRAFAGLERDVVVIGVSNRLEIWEPQAWADYRSAQEAAFVDIDEGE